MLEQRSSLLIAGVQPGGFPMYRLLAAATLTTFIATAPAWAQTDTTPPSGAAPDPATITDREDTDGDGFDIGLLGLIGLAGLAGLAGRNRRRVNDNSTIRRP